MEHEGKKQKSASRCKSYNTLTGDVKWFDKCFFSWVVIIGIINDISLDNNDGNA